ncbi:MAG: hypothetical protein IPQ07_44850 [Myxococcales bacterium]|nr:hypothetical protein [Myxococcales bacterium]
MEVLVVARGVASPADLVEAEPLRRASVGFCVPATVEDVLLDRAVVAHHPGRLAAEEALHELLDPEHVSDRQADDEEVDATELPADEVLEIRHRAALERQLQLAPRLVLELERLACGKRGEQAGHRARGDAVGVGSGNGSDDTHDRYLRALSIT